jgi:magnesium-transporting ATPase (P-type)
MAIVFQIVILASGGAKIRVSLKSQRLVLEMASFSQCYATVYRDGAWTTLDAKELVPGDCIEVKRDSRVLPVDCILIRGSGMLYR